MTWRHRWTYEGFTRGQTRKVSVGAGKGISILNPLQIEVCQGFSSTIGVCFPLFPHKWAQLNL